MSAGLYNILIEQGADFEQTFTIVDDAGDPVNITGATIRGQVRLTASDPALVVAFTCSVVNGPTGQGKFGIPAATTTTIPCNPSDLAERTITPASYDLEIQHLSGKIERLLQGIASISPEVTR